MVINSVCQILHCSLLIATMAAISPYKDIVAVNDWVCERIQKKEKESEAENKNDGQKKSLFRFLIQQLNLK